MISDLKKKRKLIIESSSSKSKSKSKSRSKSRSKSSTSSQLMPDISPELKLQNEAESVSEEELEPSTDSLGNIKKLLETRIKNLSHLENVMPTKYLNYDPSCIRKYSNFSFPKDYKKFYGSR
jgi:hypothetical protein